MTFKIGMVEGNYIDEDKIVYIPNREATRALANELDIKTPRWKLSSDYDRQAMLILYAEIAWLQTQVAELAEANSGIPDWARQVNELLAENAELQRKVQIAKDDGYFNE